MVKQKQKQKGSEAEIGFSHCERSKNSKEHGFIIPVGDVAENCDFIIPAGDVAENCGFIIPAGDVAENCGFLIPAGGCGNNKTATCGITKTATITPPKWVDE